MHHRAGFSVILLAILILMSTRMQAQGNQPLAPVQQSLVRIAALTATGDLERLSTELSQGLEAGLTVSEIRETLVQLYAYCGFPRSLNAIQTFMKVLEDRKAKGIKDDPGKATGSHEGVKDRYEQGRKVLETLTKTPQPKPAPGFGEFAPRIDAFLKEHLFADVFSSNVLSYSQRELVTIAALAAMDGVHAQLQSHVKMGMNTGLTPGQLSEVARLMEQFIGLKQANGLRKAIGMPETPDQESSLMVRISEIEILPEYLDEYKAILNEESAASVNKEPGVIAIFPMVIKAEPTQIRIVEIYANKAAYESHVKTPHFQHYKTSTLNMVKSLKLVDMNTLDEASRQAIFKK